MNWLWNNPIGSMYGPYFLWLYAAFIGGAIVAARWRIRSSDPTQDIETPAVPESPDPYLVAYLRGGNNEVSRLALFDLLERGLALQTQEQSGLIKRQHFRLAPDANLKELPEPLLSVAKWLQGRGRDASRIFQDRIADSVAIYTDAIQQEAERLELATTSEELARQRQITRQSWLSVIALGGYKLFAALMTGHRNVGGLFLFAFFGCLLIRWLGGPQRLTDLGRRTLKALQTAFAGLKGKPTGEPGPDPRFVLAVGVFGVAALQGTAHAAFYDLYRSSALNASSACSAGGSSSDGGGSSCGGGGGGGCGGCGG